MLTSTGYYRILELISDKKTISRLTLLFSLKDISDYQLDKAIQWLKHEGLIIYYPTQHGYVLTEKGLEFKEKWCIT